MRTTSWCSLSAATTRLGTGSRSTKGTSGGITCLALRTLPAEVWANPALPRRALGRDAPQLDQLESHRLDLRQDPVEGGLVWNDPTEHGVLTVDMRTQVGKGAEHAWP